MLNTIKESIANAVARMTMSDEERRKMLQERYPDDPMVGRIQWVPVGSASSNFCTHKLVQISPLRMDFRPTIATRLFAGIFVLAGLGIMAVPLLAEDAPWWVALFGLLFAAAGGLMYHFMARPTVFDMEKLWYWKGRRPETAQEVEARDNTASLDRVVALQALRQYCHGGSGQSRSRGYYCYELNLVLDDTTRINVISHGNHRALLRDARLLAEFLGVPLWDASDL